MKTLLAMALLCLPAFASQNPSLSQEGNRTILKAEAYIAGGDAQNTCSYKLINEEYWENASGTLTINGNSLSCKSVTIGEDMVTLCQDGQNNDFYPYVVSFDGAEANFFVWNGVFDPKQVCEGVAN